MSDNYPPEEFPLPPRPASEMPVPYWMQPRPPNPAFEPEFTNTLRDELRQQNRVLRAAVNHLLPRDRDYVDLIGMQIDHCPIVDVVEMSGRVFRVRVDRAVQNSES